MLRDDRRDGNESASFSAAEGSPSMSPDTSSTRKKKRGFKTTLATTSIVVGRPNIAGTYGEKNGQDQKRIKVTSFDGDAAASLTTAANQVTDSTYVAERNPDDRLRYSHRGSDAASQARFFPGIGLEGLSSANVAHSRLQQQLSLALGPWNSSLTNNIVASTVQAPNTGYSGVGLDLNTAHLLQLQSRMAPPLMFLPSYNNYNPALVRILGPSQPNPFISLGVPPHLGQQLRAPPGIPSFAGQSRSGSIQPAVAGLDMSSFQNPAMQMQMLDVSSTHGFFSGIEATSSRATTIASDGFPVALPVLLALPEDDHKLSAHQVLLRQQIEAFQANEDEVTTHTRGRNKPITLGQVGIRCIHCRHVPVNRRQKGSTYYPASLLGLYQAAQNMSTTHMQCGLCSEMPESIKRQFAQLLGNKAACSGAGRPYWAKSAEKLGLVDTEEGIRFFRDLPPGLKVIRPEDSNK